MKITLKFFPALLLLFLLGLAACNKSNAPLDFTQLTTTTIDINSFGSATDETLDDANTVLVSNANLSGGRMEGSDLCNASISFDTTGSNRTVTITYNGLNCTGTATRGGQLIISLPQNVYWKDSGAVLTVNYSNLKYTSTVNNQSIILNGAGTVTNVTGGLIPQLSTYGTITHVIDFSSGITLTFDNGAIGTWMISCKRMFTYDNGIVITTTGTRPNYGVDGISVWGTNRFGKTFVVQISQPMTIRQDCAFRLTSGELTTTGMQTNAWITFGLNSSGGPISCPGLGHYYYEIAWVGSDGYGHAAFYPY